MRCSPPQTHSSCPVIRPDVRVTHACVCWRSTRSRKKIRGGKMRETSRTCSRTSATGACYAFRRRTARLCRPSCPFPSDTGSISGIFLNVSTKLFNCISTILHDELIILCCHGDFILAGTSSRSLLLLGFRCAIKSIKSTGKPQKSCKLHNVRFMLSAAKNGWVFPSSGMFFI